jgi:RNA polymerase sigma-70 factor, ECF subfamily
MTGSPGLAVTLPRGVLTVPDKANTSASQWRLARRIEGEEAEVGNGGFAGAKASVTSGDIADFRSLFDAHGEKMKSVAYQLLRNHSDAEDAVQEAFLKAYRGAGSFRGQSAFSTWVYRILVNACHDMRRKRSRREESIEERVGGEREDHLPQIADRPASGQSSLKLELNRALEGLHPMMRTVFLLFEAEGFRHREISEMLDIPEGTSKNLLFRAKRELQEILLARRRTLDGGLL